VWGRAALLAGLFAAFLAAKSTVDDDGSGVDEEPAPEPVRPGGT
jgi:hypothetical protein